MENNAAPVRYMATECDADGKAGYMLAQFNDSGRIAVEQWTESLDFLDGITIDGRPAQAERISPEEYDARKKEAGRA